MTDTVVVVLLDTVFATIINDALPHETTLSKTTRFNPTVGILEHR